MTQSALAQLPPELRNHIYELVLRHEEPIRIQWRQDPSGVQALYSHPHVAGRRPLALTATCKAIRKETWEMFFTLNEIEIQSLKPCGDPGVPFSLFTAAIGTKAVQNLKALVFLYPAQSGCHERIAKSIMALKEASGRCSALLVKSVIPFIVAGQQITVKVELESRSFPDSLDRALLIVQEMWRKELEATTKAGLRKIIFVLQTQTSFELQAQRWKYERLQQVTAAEGKSIQ